MKVYAGIRLDDTGFHSPDLDALFVQWGLTDVTYQVVLNSDHTAYRVDMCSDVWSSDEIIARLPKAMHVIYLWEKSGRSFVGWTPSAYRALIECSFWKYSREPNLRRDNEPE